MKNTTEKERLEAKRQYMKQYYQKNKEKIAEQQKQYKKQYYQTNKEKFAEYYQDNKEKMAEHYQANREKILEQRKQYYQDNKEKITEYSKQYRQDNREKITEQQRQYHQTPMGRAVNLVSAHNQDDKKHNRGECTLTARWIVENIFNSKCIYCGESDWHKLGCDRKDNSLPHTKDNVVPCCASCNKKRGTKSFEEFLNENKKRGL